MGKRLDPAERERRAIEKAFDWTAVHVVYADRAERRTHPEGRADNGGRWYPTDAEDGGGDGTKGRSPSRAWPWGYMTRCRTREHCRELVARGVAGLPVPSDVGLAVAVMLLWLAGYEAPTPAACRIAFAVAPAESRLRWLHDLRSGGETAECAFATMAPQELRAAVCA